ncbi:MAG TPA: alpha/beta fold hydrolase [Ktedonobacteraceae bacterium]
MLKIVGRLSGALIRLLGLSLLATAVIAVVVALRHMLDTPQQLESELPGEARIYRWKQGHIFYKVLGAPDAPPLLLLHTPEVGGSAYEMRGILELLATHYRVYAPDLLGFGLSDRPRIDYSAETYISLCRDFLVDVVAQPATIVASRVSCNYALTVAATSPALCERLVLISPVALYSDDQKSALIASLVEAPAIKSLLYPLLSTRFALYCVLARQNLLKAEADLDHYYAATHQLGAEHAAMALLAGKLTYDAAEQFEKLQQPTLIIWGAYDLNVSRRITGQHGVPEHARVVLLQNAGLAVHEEHPGAVVAAIQRWGEDRQQVETSHKVQPLPNISHHVEAQPGGAQIIAPNEEKEVTDAPSIPVESQNGQVPEPIAATTGQEEASNPLPVQEPENTTTEQEEAGSLPVEAWCVKCKKKTPVRNAHEVTMKNGRIAIRGTCEVCGTNLHRIGRLVSES